MDNNTKQLKRLLSKIEPKYRKYALDILKTEKERLQSAPGGLHKHQNWRGGYVDHLIETMAIATILYETMDKKRPLPFSLSDALYVLFFHDLEKIFNTTVDSKGKSRQTELANNPDYASALIIVKRQKIPFTKMQQIALTYVEGENEDYDLTKRVMNPLAAFVHCCDTISARIWFDEPKKSGPL